MDFKTTGRNNKYVLPSIVHAHLHQKCTHSIIYDSDERQEGQLRHTHIQKWYIQMNQNYNSITVFHHWLNIIGYLTIYQHSCVSVMRNIEVKSLKDNFERQNISVKNSYRTRFPMSLLDNMMQSMKQLSLFVQLLRSSQVWMERLTLQKPQAASQ